MKATFTYLRNVISLTLLFVSFSSLRANDDFAGLQCPPDEYVSCNDELWDLSVFGNATYHDYSGYHDAGTPVMEKHLNSCNIGYITRTWTRTIYGIEYTCSQTIHVEGSAGNIEIEWPEDLELDGCNPNVNPNYLDNGKPTWTSEGCAMLGSAYKDTWYNFGTNHCKKLIRDWTVKNWCTYDYNSNNYVGVYKHRQVIKISSEDVPVVTCPEDVEAAAYNCVSAQVNVAPLVVDPTTCGGEFNITNDSPYASSGGSDISGIYPIGTTTVKYRIDYGCGKKEFCSVDITVKDTKSPTPYCYAEMAVALMGVDTDDDGINDEGMVEIWAKDLDAGSYGNCNDQMLYFSFSEDTTETFKIFTCDDVGMNDVKMYVTDRSGNYNWCTVSLSVQNNAANIDNCVPIDTSSNPDIENPGSGGGSPENNSGVNPDLFVSGKVFDGFGTEISSASIQLQSMDEEWLYYTYIDSTEILNIDSTMGTDGEWIYEVSFDTVITEMVDSTLGHVDIMAYSDISGLYEFSNWMRTNGTYKIIGYAMEERPSRIDGNDLRAIFDHVKDRNLISSPYQLLAADVDNDGDIDMSDVMEVMRMVTGQKKSFSSEIISKSIRADLDFSNPEDILLGNNSDHYMVENIQESEDANDFVVVFLGKLRATVSQNARSTTNTRSDIDFSTLHNLNGELAVLELNRIFGYSENIVELKLYPNPAEDLLTIEVSAGNQQNPTLKVISLDGKVMIQENLNLQQGINHHQVSITALTPGLYFLQVEVDGLTRTKKLIKK